MIDRRERAVLCDEFLGRAPLDDLAVAEIDDLVAVEDGGDAVRGDDERAVGTVLLDGSEHAALRRHVERGRGVVEDEDGRALDERPRDGEALLLPARKPHAALAHHRLVARFELADELVCLRDLRGAHDFLFGDVGMGEGDVGVHRVGEEKDVLEDVGELRTERFQRIVADVGAVEGDIPRRHVVDAAQALQKHRFAAARAPHDAQLLAVGKIERDVL